MRRLISDLARRDPLNAELVAVAALGCGLAVSLGAAIATRHSELVVGGFGTLALLASALVLYSRDPVLAFIWLWLFEVFNAPLSAMAGYFSPTGEAIRQGDELLVVLLLALTIWRAARTSTRMPPLWCVLPAVGVAICGLLGAFTHDAPFAVTVVGAWLGLKLWTMLIIAFLLPWTTADVTRVYRIFTRVGLFVAAFGLVDYLSHAAVSSALGTSIYRFTAGSLRGEAAHSIFPHPGEFSLFMSLLFALTFARFAAKRRKSDLILALCFAGSVMLSARLKGFLSIVAVIAIIAFVQALAANRGGIAILLIGTLLLFGFYDVEGSVITKQISTYTSSETSARAKLYTTSTRIADNAFPLGAGFGRFATYASRLYYSPVYQEYELNNVFGLSRKFPDFIDDTSWPGVIGETGYAGFAIYLIGIVMLVVALTRRMRVTVPELRWMPLAALCAVAVLLVDSLGDPTLFDWLALTGFVLILGPALVPTDMAPTASNR